MNGRKVVLTAYRQNYMRRNWYVDLGGEVFTGLITELKAELLPLGIDLSFQENADITIDINSYADLLNSLRISSPGDGVTSRCVGHIIGKSPNLDLLEDVRRAVNRVAFAPETIPPDDENRKVCHNCGCGC